VNYPDKSSLYNIIVDVELKFMFQNVASHYAHEI